MRFFFFGLMDRFIYRIVPYALRQSVQTREAAELESAVCHSDVRVSIMMGARAASFADK